MGQKLEIKDVFIFADKKEIVHDMSLSIECGSMHVLMGKNGSGKSTFVNALFGHPAYEIQGTLMLDGRDIMHETTEKKARAGLFLSMQYLPVIEGVTLATFLHKAYSALHGENVSSVLDFYMQAEEMAKSLLIDPSFLKRSVHAGMSGGEKKLSEILQLAVLHPRFAILDEIDSGVDVDSQKIVFEAIKTLQKKGTGFLLITHYDSLLRHIKPDFVHVMHEGRLVRSGASELAHEITTHGFASVY